MGDTLDSILNERATDRPPAAAGGNMLDSILSEDPRVRLGQDIKDMPPATYYDPRRAASMGDIAVASLTPDMNARINYYARQRGIDPKRYQIVNGRIAYEAEDGRLYLEEPYKRIVPRSFTEAGQRLSQEAGPIIPAITGTLAGIASAPLMLTGPGGMAASMGITAASGAAGEAAREWIGNLVTGGKLSPGQIAQEGAVAGFGQGVGAGMTAWGQRNAVRDIQQLDRPSARALRQNAERQGIQLTPAEETGLASLAAKQKAVGNLPASSNRMRQFYEERAEDVESAVRRYLDRMSLHDSAETAGVLGKKAADRAIKLARDERRVVSRPLYQQTVNDANLVPDKAFAPIAGDEFLAAEIKRIKADKLLGMKAAPDRSMVVLDQLKKELDDQIEEAGRRGLRNRARILKDKLDTLLGVMDEAFPDYPAARAAFAGKSPGVDVLEEGIVGIIAKLPDARAKRAAQMLFDPESSGPGALLTARAALQNSSPEAWQALKRAWLQRQWERAGREFVSTGSTVVNQGPKFRALLLGDENRRRMLQTALDLPEWVALNELADVLEAAGRVKPLGSDTAWNQEIMQEMRREATPFLAKVGRALRPQDWGKLVEEWATERSVAKNAARYADIITRPGAADALKQLRVLTPGSARWRAGVAQFFTRFADYAVSTESAPSEPR